MAVHLTFKKYKKQLVEKMSKKVSGFLRVKNEGIFIERCIESCIDALDELIIVFNDCTDNSEDEINKMVAKYPHKIKSYKYPHHVLGMYITKEEFDMAKNLPEGDPALFSTYSNFALQKITSEYAVKIDADQVYFTEELKSWCDFLRECKPQKKTFKVFLGSLFSIYISFYRLLSLKAGKVLPLLPSWFVRIFYPTYISYAKYLFSHDKACLSLSGVNVLVTDKIGISMGHTLNGFKAFHSFNGCGDTVMFKMDESVRFEKFIMPEYNPPYTKTYSVFEAFKAPCKKTMFIGFFWKHLSMMRTTLLNQALSLNEMDKEAFLSVDKFKKLSYSKIMNQSPDNVCPLFQRILYAFIYKANKRTLMDYLQKK